jgi:hypothetical protein
MPRDRRPAAVLVVAILNMFFGGMNLLSLACAVPMLAVVVAVLPPLPGSDKNIFKDMFDSMNARFPILYFMIGSTVLTLILNTGLLLSGIGLWKMQVWARRTAIACAITQITVAIVMVIIQILWLNPAMADWQEHFHQTLAKPNAPPPPAIFSSGMSYAISIFGALLGSIYPIVALVILFLPHVRAAFAGVKAPTLPVENDFPEVLDASAPATESRD